MVSWLAAGVCAMWNDSDAEPRLVDSIHRNEYGYDEKTIKANEELPAWMGTTPAKHPKLAPNWLVAILLLKRCGTGACLDALAGFAAQANHSLHTRCAIALAVAGMAARGVAMDKDKAQRLLDSLLEPVPPDTVAIPQPRAGHFADEALRGHAVEDASGNPTAEDHLWQLHVSVGRARQALGLAAQPQLAAYAGDPRALVRKAVGSLAAGAPR
jgi:hypothetical protein